jgi:hypothetical protein
LTALRAAPPLLRFGAHSALWKHATSPCSFTVHHGLGREEWSADGFARRG